MEAKTFRDAYAVLQEHAETLREQTEPNIDDLLAIVTESVAAYKVCKERIDAVEKALQEALTGVSDDTGPRGADQPEGDASGRRPPVRRPSATPAPGPSGGGAFDADDDVPF